MSSISFSVIINGGEKAQVSPHGTWRTINLCLSSARSLNLFATEPFGSKKRLFFLSATTSGAITATPPSSAGQAVVRIGEAATATKLSIQIEPPIKLS